jgi:hypothetical protein
MEAPERECPSCCDDWDFCDCDEPNPEDEDCAICRGECDYYSKPTAPTRLQLFRKWLRTPLTRWEATRKERMYYAPGVVAAACYAAGIKHVPDGLCRSEDTYLIKLYGTDALVTGAVPSYFRDRTFLERLRAFWSAS